MTWWCRKVLRSTIKLSKPAMFEVKQSLLEKPFCIVLNPQAEPVQMKNSYTRQSPWWALLSHVYQAGTFFHNSAESFNDWKRQDLIVYLFNKDFYNAKASSTFYFFILLNRPIAIPFVHQLTSEEVYERISTFNLYSQTGAPHGKLHWIQLYQFLSQLSVHLTTKKGEFSESVEIHKKGGRCRLS